MALYVLPNGTQTVVVPAGSSIAVFCQGTATVSRLITSPNYPDSLTLIGTVINGQTVFGSFTNATTIVIEASGGVDVYYEIGTSPAVAENRLSWQVQPTPATLNVTGALTHALLSQGIITSTTFATVVGTLPTGPVLDAASSFQILDSLDWTVINTGPNPFSVVNVPTSGHTVVGNMAVVASSSGRFRTVKTAAATFVTYRLA